MSHRLEPVLRRQLVRWVLGVEARASQVLWAAAIVTVACAAYAVATVGLNADTVEQVSSKVRSQQLYLEFAELFPIIDHTTLVVVDAENPELARDAAVAIRDRFAAEPERYRHVYAPGLGDFFEKNGLLYLSVEELEKFADQLTQLQPLIAELERDPSFAQMAALIDEAQGQDLFGTQEADAPWVSLFEALSQTTRAIHAERDPREVQWESLLLQDLDRPVANRALVLVEPVIDFTKLGEVQEAMAAIRSEANEAAAGRATIRITGNAAINLEELVHFVWDVFIGGIFCFFLVMFVLWRAFHSWQMLAATTVTLLTGLIWAAAAAGAVVGDLTLPSLSFGILFIGLGIDFGIHLGLAYTSERRQGFSHADSLAEATREIGPSLLICTVTTAIGFFVFVPAPYTGIAELGLIAGTAMIIIFFLTLTLLPALLTKGLRLPAGSEDEPLGLPVGWSHWLEARSVWIRRLALVAAVAIAALLPRATFDPMVFGLRDPSAESIQAVTDLMEMRNQLSPLVADALAANAEEAEALAKKLESLDVVDSSLTLGRFVPEDQEDKIAILEDLAFLLDRGFAAEEAPPSHTTAEQEDGIRRVVEALRTEAARPGDPAVRAEMRELADTLEGFLSEARERGELGGSLEQLQQLTLGPLPRHLDRLRNALLPDEITLEGLPPEIVDRQVANDGRVRVAAYPAEDLFEPGALERFVEEVEKVAPDATGMAPNVIGFARATIDSFEQALTLALVSIAILLVLLWQRVREPLLVLAPLLLGAGGTVAIMAAADIPFNFGNVLVIPLLLGAGVDSGIHLVQRGALRRQTGQQIALLSSTTARAVLYSATTTIVSFGALAFSSHVAMSSLGKMLTIGMLCMLVSNLVVLPALIDRWPPGREADADA